MNKHVFFIFFFFNDTATTEIYTLSLHDALPICERVDVVPELAPHERIDAAGGLIEKQHRRGVQRGAGERQALLRSEEHTSELQSQSNLVCRLLLEKKKKQDTRRSIDVYSGRCCLGTVR